MLLIEKYTRQQIKNMVNDGLISWQVLLKFDIYLVYDAYIRSGQTVCTSVTWTADKFCKSERRIFQIIKEMQIKI